MSGVPSGWRMIARNWYSVLNASMAMTWPRKSSRVRFCGVTSALRSTPMPRESGGVRLTLPLGGPTVEPSLHVGPAPGHPVGKTERVGDGNHLRGAWGSAPEHCRAPTSHTFLGPWALGEDRKSV